MAGEKKQEAAAADDADVSMEDILQSIRRIIADEGDEAAPAAANGAAPVDSGSDVLELTEMLAEDGSVTSLKDAPKAPEPAKPAAPAGGDVLSKIDTMLAPQQPEPPKEAAAPPPPPAPVTPPAPPAPAAVKKEEPMPSSALSLSDKEDASILAPKTVETVTSTINKLDEALEPPAPHIQSAAFASGNTVENMVMEMLRPMMKSWLDSNLPVIVERIVEREVRKLIR